jgi:copper chaperone
VPLSFGVVGGVNVSKESVPLVGGQHRGGGLRGGLGDKRHGLIVVVEPGRCLGAGEEICCSPRYTLIDATEKEDNTMTQFVAHVTGLTCGHCVNTVTGALEAIDGIDAVEVELVNGGESLVTMTTSTDDDLLAAIAQTLATEGYALQSLSNQDSAK